MSKYVFFGLSLFLVVQYIQICYIVGINTPYSNVRQQFKICEFRCLHAVYDTTQKGMYSTYDM